MARAEQLVRFSLWVTAPLNLVAGFSFAVPANPMGQLIRLPQQEPSIYTLMSGGMVALFGIVYFWLARQEVLFKPVLGIGAAGKLMAVLIAISLFLKGDLPLVPALLISGDLLFVLLWGYYLFEETGG